MATNSSVKKIITIEVQGNQAKASIDGVTMSTKQLNTELKTLSQVAGKSKAKGSATGGATATVLELGRTISDSNYGIRGMANNLSQLVSNLVFTTRAAGGLTAGLKSIWSALMGPLGLVLAGQAAIAMLEKYSMESNSAADASDDLNSSIKTEIRTLKIYESALHDVNTTLEERVGIIKGLSVLDKDLAKQLKEAGDDTEKISKIIKDYTKQRELEVKIAEKKKELDESLLKLQKEQQNQTIGGADVLNKLNKRNISKQDIINAQNKLKEERQESLNKASSEYNEILGEFLRLMAQVDLEEEKRGKKAKTTTKKAKAPVIGDPIFDVDSLMEGYDEAKTMEFDLRRRYLESRALFFDEARIQASEANNKVLEDEIAHREKMLLNTDIGSIERIEAENELSIMRMDLKDQELEHEIMIIEARRNINMEYVSFMNGIGRALASASQKGSALATAALIIQKGAAIASIVVEAQRSIAEATSATGSANQKVADFYAPMGFAGIAPMAAQIAANSSMLAANNARTKIGAGISIANILATTIGGNKNIKGTSSSTAGAVGGGGRTFDFNLVGTTGTNQLAEAVGAQFQEPIQAFVVSSQITSQQELDLEISTGASLGD
tara:strand:- start:23 stop:1858 length:1836 start_codon:yes stop_codon:yes gene_type:complete